MQAEQAKYDDVIFVPKPPGSSAGYRSIVYKTFALVEWVAGNASPRFILKTDDDAYVNTANLVAALQRVLHLSFASSQCTFIEALMNSFLLYVCMHDEDAACLRGLHLVT